MLKPDDLKRARFLGRSRASSELAGMMTDEAMPIEGAEAYAAGMVDGVRDFVSVYVSEQAAYEMLQAAADATLAHRAANTVEPLS
ncbi:hypothetical protein [Beijerinckia sp. L45]|uniref:hypothetical protein n=1 Tax=Beijerinckia sp. L45 TaxID=1641855 RepID=UPI00131B67CB|nr:hypothetical protein [Beijerinckia sp. L45]